MSSPADILAAAQQATANGLCVVPPREDGSKAPDAPSWKQFQTRRPTRAELTAWYRDTGRHGLGLVCGAISGGLELFEFEALAVAQGLDVQWAETMRDIGAHELAARLLDGYSERSASGGLHLLYRCEVTKTEKLASTPEHRTLIETKGEGGYVIVAPSHGPVSPADGAWQLLAGDLTTIPTITPEERAIVHRVARTLDQTIPADKYRQPIHHDQAGPSPLDLYREASDVQTRTVELLEKHGWTIAGQSGDATYLRRPGKTDGISATVGHIAPGVVTIFTTSTHLDARTYTPGDLLAHLEHGGDLGAATRALRDLGYRPPEDRTTPVLAATPEHETAGTDGPELTTWEPVDLAAAWSGQYSDPEPTILHRTDGIALIYPGKVSTLQGESESLKTWGALCAVAEQLAAGRPCLYVDFEDAPHSIIDRLRLLGVTPTPLFTYLRPDAPFSLAARDQLDQMLYDLPDLALVVIDGVTEAMTAEGLDLISNQDIARWMRILPRWIARHDTGPAVVTIDHVPKNPDGRGKGAIGGQHKRAGIDGIGLTFTVGSEPLARGRDGRARITIDKDRPGHARAHAADKGWIGDLVISHTATGLAWAIDPPLDADTSEPRANPREQLVETVLDLLKHPSSALTDGTGWSVRALSTALREMDIPHRDKTLREVLDSLAYRGEALTDRGANGYPRWRAACG